MRKIHLFGVLAEKFGSVWEIEVSNAKEAVSAINANTKGKFFEVIRPMKLAISRGSDIKNAEPIFEETIEMNYGDGDFFISPAPKGSGPAAIVIGAILIAGTIAVIAFGDKLFPYDPPSDRTGNLETDGSFIFGNVINSSRQGQPIPLIYGEVYTGSIVISQGMKAIELTS